MRKQPQFLVDVFRPGKRWSWVASLFRVPYGVRTVLASRCATHGPVRWRVALDNRLTRKYYEERGVVAEEHAANLRARSLAADRCALLRLTRKAAARS